MAGHLRDNVLHGRNHENTHLDDGRYRHQEKTSYARHVNYTPQIRLADERGTVTELSKFLNESRVEPQTVETNGPHRQSRHSPIVVSNPETSHMRSKPMGDTDGASSPAFVGNGADVDGLDAADKGAGAQNTSGQTHQERKTGPPDGRETDGKEVRCGPLLNYRRMDGKTWYGSVLVVVRGGRVQSDFVPELTLSKGTDIQQTVTMSGNNDVLSNKVENISRSLYDHESKGRRTEGINGTGVCKSGDRRIRGVKLYSDPRNMFWRFKLEVEMTESEQRWEYRLQDLRFPSGKESDHWSFHVPAQKESMRIMFHSCNGFSVGTDEEAWSGAALWNDVLRMHHQKPFHVMLGGGDQIYNDGIRVDGPLRPWTDIRSPNKRKDYPFPEQLRKECDDYYAANYIRWYATEPFSSANCSIPQVNLWDDHDIIDGFGSYVNDFMKCDVFRGIGGTAYKYYMLFQHHLPPPVSTYTTDAPQTMDGDGCSPDPAQLRDTYVLKNEAEDPCYIIGPKPGPYVAERSRSIYAKLGARIGFFGIDARTERTRHQVNYPETYDIIFDRLRRELTTETSGPTPMQHLIVLLGIPIAYPRLTWLENIFASPLMGPIKFLNKRFGVGGGFFNHFDGSVDLLDDLDDHYTARTHKHERHDLMVRLQKLAGEFSVRITILGGDVHLAALGRFYSNPKLDLPASQDHRYIANVISSAIVNKPPPTAVANLLARRNKIHHLNENTDETLLKIFDKDPGKEAKTSGYNHVTMPSRNWAMITENSPTIRTTQASTDQQHVNGTSMHNHMNGNTDTNGHPHQTNGDTTVNGYPARANGNTTANGYPIQTNGNTTHNGYPTHTNGKTDINDHLNRIHDQTTGLSTDLDVHEDKLRPTPEDSYTGRDGHQALHLGEEDAGTTSRAANDKLHGTAGDGSLDVCLRVERDQHDKEGRTTSYGMWIPPLRYDKLAGAKTMRKRDAMKGAINARS